ncbi:IS5 family transposase [Streptomyces mirabilis]|uniref:IS5 family transposase n=1 Tax=Streptomyces mirabilis TaxID=68239 RepID=UPI00368CA273
MGRGDLTDEQWARPEPSLPVGKKPGRPPVWSKRQLINGIRWRTRTGVPWRDVPARYGEWETVYGLFRRRQRNDTWKHPHPASDRGRRAGPDHLGRERGLHSRPCPPARSRGSQKGDLQRDKPGGIEDEPADHGLGRSRGGLTTKLHLAVEQGHKPLALIVTAGQRRDSPQFRPVLERIRVPRIGSGRPRTKPNRIRADRAYGSRVNRAYLRRRGIHCTIPEKVDQIRNRKRLGAHGGRPPRFDKADYRERHAGGVRDQPTQAPPRGGHQVRQTRRPLRSHSHYRRHQRVAVPSTFTTRPSRNAVAFAVGVLCLAVRPGGGSDGCECV